MDKEKYIKPEIEIVEFDCEDVLTASSPVVPGVGLPDDDFDL